MSVPKCPSCSTPVPLRGSFSTTAKVPLSKTCTSCGEGLPDSILPKSKCMGSRRRTHHELLMRRLRG